MPSTSTCNLYPETSACNLMRAAMSSSSSINKILFLWLIFQPQCAEGACIHKLLQNLDFGCVKASGFDDRKVGCIALILPTLRFFQWPSNIFQIQEDLMS